MKGEFEFIDDIRRMFADISKAADNIPGNGTASDCILGMGDDCAVTRQDSGYVTLTSTDMLVEGTHFLREDITPYQLGWKSAAVNFSDIAAMGGIPVGSYLALALPAGLPEGWTDAFLKGYHDISKIYGFPLLGGDTTASEKNIVICVTVQGKAHAGNGSGAASAAGYHLRSSAKAGDLVCVTGTLGDSAAGLEVILKGLPREENARLIERHYLPHPRISEGRQLAASAGVHAMMDISDGIGSDLLHIMEETNAAAGKVHGTAGENICIEIDLPALPLSDELLRFCKKYGYDPLHFAAEGGEDYELLFTVDPATEPSLSVPHHIIGRIVEYNATNGTTGTVPGTQDAVPAIPAIRWKDADGRIVSNCNYCGYRHF